MNKKLSRREFLRTTVAAPTIINSIVVRVQPSRCDALANFVITLQGCEIVWRAPDSTKLVLILESDSEFSLLEHIQKINETDGVIAADLSYSYNEDLNDG